MEFVKPKEKMPFIEPKEKMAFIEPKDEVLFIEQKKSFDLLRLQHSLLQSELRKIGYKLSVAALELERLCDHRWEIDTRGSYHSTAYMCNQCGSYQGG
jgi:hypothetical protein